MVVMAEVMLELALDDDAAAELVLEADKEVELVNELAALDEDETELLVDDVLEVVDKDETELLDVLEVIDVALGTYAVTTLVTGGSEMQLQALDKREAGYDVVNRGDG